MDKEWWNVGVASSRTKTYTKSLTYHSSKLETLQYCKWSLFKDVISPQNLVCGLTTFLLALKNQIISSIVFKYLALFPIKSYRTRNYLKFKISSKFLSV
jgi:hypothetical protein